MKSMLKSVGYVLLVGCMGISLYAINLFLMKPYSIDHYLAKELALDTLDSPETMTYLGVFDDYNFLLKHNQKLSIGSLEKDEEDHSKNLNQLETLQSYEPDEISSIQKVTRQIAIFDVENDINAVSYTHLTLPTSDLV